MNFAMPIMTVQLETQKSSHNVLGSLPTSLPGAGAHSWAVPQSTVREMWLIPLTPLPYGLCECLELLQS